MSETTKQRRKTIDIETVKEIANRMLAAEDTSTLINNDWRLGVAWLLEELLHKTRNYRGYQHNEWSSGGFSRWCNDGKPDFPEKWQYLGNDTKRFYF